MLPLSGHRTGRLKDLLCGRSRETQTGGPVFSANGSCFTQVAKSRQRGPTTRKVAGPASRAEMDGHVNSEISRMSIARLWCDCMTGCGFAKYWVITPPGRRGDRRLSFGVVLMSLHGCVALYFSVGYSYVPPQIIGSVRASIQSNDYVLSLAVHSLVSPAGLDMCFAARRANT